MKTLHCSDTAYKLLEKLSDGQFHSGQQLGETLHITRTAIWKAIKQLQNLGVAIQAISGKGYCIQHGIELLDKQQILHYIAPYNQTLIKQLNILQTVDSTNNYLLNKANSGSSGDACFAEYQTHARGRRGKTWHAPFASNIYHSLLWQFAKDPAEIVGLSLAIALAVTAALRRYGIQQDIQLKWPNDVLWQGRKLCGVLVEMLTQTHVNCSVVIGVGINTYLPPTIGKQIDQPWVDIRQITQQPTKRNQLAGLLLDELLSALTLFEQQGLSPFLTDWQALDPTLGKRIKLITPQGDIYGTMQGISQRGELILLTEQGETRYFYSGEVSLRSASQDNL